MRTPTTIASAFLFLLAIAAPARAEDDPVDLLRAARTAETVDRDLEKAMDLYRRAMAGTSDASRDAALALARVQEERGMQEESLETLVHATEVFGERMTDEQKRSVHEAMLRLVRPGRTVRSPLGEVSAAVGTGGGPISPLDRKVDELLSQIDAAPGDWQAQQRVEGLLVPLGKEVMPVLERVLYTARPERAGVAAKVYSRIGGLDAIPGLARAVLEGDGFTRKAAIEALSQYTTEESSAVLAPILDRLVADPRTATVRPTLVYLLARHLPPAELMERHRRGGEDAKRWLEQAFERNAPGATERALELARVPGEEGYYWLQRLLTRGDAAALAVALERARAGGEEGRRMVSALTPLFYPTGGRPPTFPPDSLDSATRAAFVDLLLTGDVPWRQSSILAGLLAAMREAEGDAAVRDRVLEAWRVLARAPKNNVANHLHALAFGPSAPPVPPELFADPELAARFFESWPYGSFGPFPAHLTASPLFWDALFAALPSMPADRRQAAVATIVGAAPGGVPPPETNARWLSVLDLPNLLSWGSNQTRAILEAAARSDDPRFLAFVRRNLGSHWVLYALEEYGGPGLLEFLRDVLKDPVMDSTRRQIAFHVLAENAGEEGRAEVAKIARDWTHPSAPTALHALNSKAPMAGLADLYARAAESGEEIPSEYRTALITVAGRLHVREAVPYLLRVYREIPGLAKSAGERLDSIRDYHDKIASFEAWSKGTGAPGAKDLADLLRHADPEVRRAAVLSLAALGRTEALPALVRLGAEDPDARVRKAALDAVERLSAGR